MVTRTKTESWASTAALGAVVIALCYGFARYAYGPFVPRFSETFGLTAVGAGVLGGLSTAGYGLGLLLAPRTSARSARGTVLLAAASATLGLGLMALAPHVVVFGAGITVAGAGAGLVSPGVAQLISETVGARTRDRAQTWANTGTGLGLAASAFTPLLALGWPVIWSAFAALGVLVTLVVWRQVPRAPGVPATSGPVRGVVPLLVNSVLIGVTSAPYWTFSPSRLAETGMSPVAATWCWAAIGVAGLLGGLAGRAAGQAGLRTVNLATWTLAAAGIALLALPRPGVPLALLSGALFGVTYMALTGLCILWAARLFPDRPARGITWSFAGLGVGQTVASLLTGAAAAGIGSAAVFGLAALVALTAWAQLHPRLGPP
ncbi:Predicted arabinose efflux permease, MFS family [Amycolatopsis tolypomycina]|uniref:Predicted arabinose efflux permease, MFS family n=1 Tax=Amycolatopsis tolypomycina TaxID=208445 RepID=A0A1H4WXD1_9PSEU|nr:YbfB/YjiJ family MFS transporter [Amycolatopsis tolypomycina]SEC98007.1 Predicted arabinose efflux permease, MFS family [Amycolatopsis tolypomycina]